MKTLDNFKQMKLRKEKIAMITAYDYPSAKDVEQAKCDMILVGDSLGMVVHGYESTVQVTLDEMILHTKAVKRGAKDTFIVTDMPFLTYHGEVSETISNARKMIQEGGAHAIKLEGNGIVFDMIRRLTDSGIAVISHLGLTPQSVGALGGYKVQGKDISAATKLINDAKKAESAGAFALVLECVPEALAKIITEQLQIPVIGIGGGRYTDGQVLVYHDILNYGTEHVATFVKQYVNITDIIHQGLSAYVNEVKECSFPEEKNTYALDPNVLEAIN
ncbi:3-methyl-2-oxobutanoate hydroxymethyltransferase [Priestia megaterium]